MSELIILSRETGVGCGRVPVGRRERDKRAKRERIMAAARELFAERGVSGVTTQSSLSSVPS